MWSASGGGDPLASWTAPRALRRTFDASVKGFVAELPSGGPPRPSLSGAGGGVWRTAAAAASRPRSACEPPCGLSGGVDARCRCRAVSLVHPALVMQVFVPGSGTLSFELRYAPPWRSIAQNASRAPRLALTKPPPRSCADAGGSRRRLAFSTGFAEPKATALVAQVPLPCPRGRWLNLVLHVAELVAALYPGSQLRSIEAITLGARARDAPRRALHRGAAPWPDTVSRRVAPRVSAPLRGADAPAAGAQAACRSCAAFSRCATRRAAARPRCRAPSTFQAQPQKCL